MQKIAIIGGGPAGIMTGIVAMEDKNTLQVTIFDKSDPLKTLLYTGGGRCNLSYAEYDSKKLINFFPRGGQFLLSPFSKFGVKNTQKFFSDIGVETYVQDDNRIFPTSDSAVNVRLSLIDKCKRVGIKFENLEVCEVKKQGKDFIISDGKSELKFDKIVIATGGNRLKPKCSGYEIAKAFGHSVTELRPALCGLKTKENWCKNISGVSVKNVKAKAIFNDKVMKDLNGDLLFTHSGISGPLSYKASSYCAYCDFNTNNPLILEVNFVGKPFDIFDKELTQKINQNPKKNLINIINVYVPNALANAILHALEFDKDIKAGCLTREQRKKLVKNLTMNHINIIGRSDDGEIVTAGGLDLKEVDGRTMESKLVKGLYFCGEILDIDGLTGGFNLQACWSTGYVAGTSLKNL